MTLQELRQLDRPALAAEVQTLTEQYYVTREAIRTGKEKNHGRLKYLRRAIAQAQTILGASA